MNVKFSLRSLGIILRVLREKRQLVEVTVNSKLSVDCRLGCSDFDFFSHFEV
jgi:hypothetical protein